MHRLILHVYLLLQLEIALTEDEDFSFERNVYVRVGAYGGENFHSLTLAVNSCNKAKIVTTEEIDLI